jgi:hypothetical protein
VRSVPTSGTVLVARPDLVECLGRITARESLYDWAERHPRRRTFQGRAPTFAVPLAPGADGVVRHAWHGGWLAPLTRDRWRAPGRAALEAELSDALRARGVPTPEVLAWATYAAGRGLVRYDVVTALVPGADDLATVIAEGDEARAAAGVGGLGRLMVRLAFAGAHHADLNLKNVLIDAAGDAHVIDVDRVRLAAGAPADVLARNWARLARSAAKWHTHLGPRVPAGALARAWADSAREVARRGSGPESGAVRVIDATATWAR